MSLQSVAQNQTLHGICLELTNPQTPFTSPESVVLEELRQLTTMLQSPGLWDTQSKIGSELEFVLIDTSTGRPAFCAAQVLKLLSGDELNFGTELLLSNIESSAPPVMLESGALYKLHSQLQQALCAVEHAAKSVQENGLGSVGAAIAGILPSYQRCEVEHSGVLSSARYHNMDAFLIQRRGGSFDVIFEGIEKVTHPLLTSMAFEGLPTSHQLHLSGTPDELVALYNAATLALAPLIAVSANSPIVAGHIGWHESRIALFENGAVPDRFFFPTSWARHPADLFSDLALFELITLDENGKPGLIQKKVAQESSPERHGINSFESLMRHNGTVWKWLRPCYGVNSEGTPHVRIEMRAMSAGPTALDMTANAALFYGLVHAIRNEHPHFAHDIPIEVAKRDFYAAARYGLDAEISWLGMPPQPVKSLAAELIAMSARGLASIGIPRDEAELYLTVIEQRCISGRTGSQWILDSLRELENTNQGSRDQHLCYITRAMHALQTGTGLPVGKWPLASQVMLPSQ